MKKERSSWAVLAGAERAAAGGDHGHRLDVVPPAVAIGADDVDVAGARLVDQGLAESLVAHVHGSQFELQVGHGLGCDLHLDDHLGAGDDGRPELAVVAVVGGGEGDRRL
ncbi:MAG: hypothetical protein IPH09_12280 [bacterium]|nr:hypothetical protein [bacterium]